VPPFTKGYYKELKAKNKIKKSIIKGGYNKAFKKSTKHTNSALKNHIMRCMCSKYPWFCNRSSTHVQQTHDKCLKKTNFNKFSALVKASQILYCNSSWKAFYCLPNLLSADFFSVTNTTISGNTAKVGTKHQSINQSIKQSSVKTLFFLVLFCL